MSADHFREIAALKIESGEVMEGFELLQLALNEDPFDEELAHYIYEVARDVLHDYDQALDYCKLIGERFNNHYHGVILEARTYYEQRDYEKALELFETVLSEAHSEQDLWDAQIGEALSTYQLGLYQEANYYFSKVVHLESEWLLGITYYAWSLYYAGDLNLALEYANRSVLLGGDHNPFSLSVRGMIHFELGNHLEAIMDLKIALETHTAWPNGFATLGWAYFEINYFENQYEEAIEAFNRAIEIVDEPYYFAYAGRGCSYYMSHAYQLAIDDFNIALNNDPQWTRGLVFQSWSYLELRHYNLAQESFNKALEQASDNKYALAGLGMAYLGLNKYELAIEKLQLALDKDNPWGRVMASLGFAYLNLGINKSQHLIDPNKSKEMPEFSNAKEYFEWAIKIDSTNEYARSGLAYTLEYLGHTSQAIEEYRHLNRNHDWQSGEESLGWLLINNALKESDYIEAKEAFIHALNINPESKQSRIGLVICYYHLCDYKRSHFNLHKVDSLDWNDYYLYKARLHVAFLEYQQALPSIIKHCKTKGFNQVFHEYIEILLLNHKYLKARIALKKRIKVFPNISYSYVMLGHLTQKKSKTRYHRNKAHQYYLKGYNCKIRSSLATAALTDFYYQEEKHTNNYTNSIEIIMKTPQENLGKEELYLRAYFYYHGIGVSVDKEKALELIQLSLNKDNLDPLGWYLLMVVQKDLSIYTYDSESKFLKYQDMLKPKIRKVIMEGYQKDKDFIYPFIMEV